MNDLLDKIDRLFDKETSAAYQNLKDLEELSEKEDKLYPFFDDFLEMLKSDKYAVRVRGFRLICKQAKWDAENKIDRHIDEILKLLNDEKPTAVGQALQFLSRDVIPHKKELHTAIQQAVSSINFSKFNADTMRPLLQREADKLIKQINER